MPGLYHGLYPGKAVLKAHLRWSAAAATLRRLFRRRIFFSRMRANGVTPRNQVAAGREFHESTTDDDGCRLRAGGRAGDRLAHLRRRRSIRPRPSRWSFRSAPAAAPTSSAASSRSACRRSSGSRWWSRTSPGAGGLLGNEQVANSPKDGYTLGVQTAGQIIAAAMTKTMRYDAVEAFDWIGQIATAGLLIVVRPDYPHKDIKSLVAAAKANPASDQVRQSRASARRSTWPPSCSSRTQASTCCTCRIALRPRRWRRCFRRTSTCCSTPSPHCRPGPVRAGSGARGHRQGPLLGGAERTGRVEVRRGAELRRHHLVRPVRAEGHAGAGDRQAQQGAQRNARRKPTVRERLVKAGVDSEGLDAAGIGANSWSPNSKSGARCAKRPGSSSDSGEATTRPRAEKARAGRSHMRAIPV